MSESKKGSIGLPLLYASALAVITMTAGVSADWPYGCCEDAANECSGSAICVDGPNDCSCGTFTCTENFCQP
jgi:hypothetical protein